METLVRPPPREVLEVRFHGRGGMGGVVASQILADSHSSRAGGPRRSPSSGSSGAAHQ